MELSILIVNYNVKEYLEHCLRAVEKATEHLSAEVLVADNHSTDGSQDYLQGRFPTVKFHWLPENLGFGKANNFLLRQAKGRNILFLNPDTLLGEHTLENLLAFVRDKKNLGALGVHMINGTGKFLPESKRNIPRARNSFFKMLGVEKVVSSKTANHYYDLSLPPNAVGKTQILCGAFMWLSDKARDFSNGFDERFFMYGEDVDLSLRILEAGLENYYVGTETLIHFKGKSNQDQQAHVHRFFEAMQVFTRKHYAAKPYSQRVLQAGIFLGKTKSQLAARLRGKKTTTLKGTWCVVGNKTDLELFTSLLQQKFSVPDVAVVEVSTAMDDKLLPPLVEDILEKKIENLLLCEGALSFESLIKITAAYGDQVNIFMHGSGTKSIISAALPPILI